VPESSILDVGLDLGLVKKTGNTFLYGDVKLGIGRENAVDMLRGDGELSKALEREILKIAFPEQKKDEKPKDEKKKADKE
jgi:recombination protein RecA